MTTIFIVKKHPPHPYGHRQFLEAFTISGIYSNRKDAAQEAKEKNEHPNTKYFYSVGMIRLEDKE